MPPLFRMAAINGIEATVIFHLRRGDNPNATDDKGRTPLLLAATMGHAKICRLLLEAGANVALRDAEGNDALSAAIKNEKTEIEKLLRSYFPPTHSSKDLSPSNFEIVAPQTDSIEFTGAHDNVSNIVLNDDFFDLAIWEEETESLPPPLNLSCLAGAEEIQKRISQHVPVNTDEDWTDIDICLPELFSLRGQRIFEESANWQVTVKEVILAGVEEGWVTVEQIAKALPLEGDADEDQNAELEQAFRVVLGDLDILVEDVPFDQDMSALQGKEEFDFYEDGNENIANAAINFLQDLSSYTNDPLSQYIRELGPRKALSKDEEMVLAFEIEHGNREAFGAIARCPEAMERVLGIIKSIELGQTPFQSIMKKNWGAEHNIDAEVADSQDDFDEDGEHKIQINTEISFDQNVPRELLDRFQTIRNLNDILDKEKVSQLYDNTADSLRNQLYDLGISRDILGDIWNIIKNDSTNAQVCFLMEQGLAKANQARLKLAEANYKLVLWVAKKYRELPLMDLVQEGNIGLFKAIDRFDPRYGAKFSTYAIWWIRQAIDRASQDKSRLIRLPVHFLELRAQFFKSFGLIQHELGREPTPAEISQMTDLPMDKILAVVESSHEHIPIETLVSDHDLALIDLLEDRKQKSPFDMVHQRELVDGITEILSSLTVQEEKIIRLRFGIGHKAEYTLEEIGKRFKVSRERIRQIEKKALNRLRHPVRMEKIKHFVEITYQSASIIDDVAA